MDNTCAVEGYEGRLCQVWDSPGVVYEVLHAWWASDTSIMVGLIDTETGQRRMADLGDTLYHAQPGAQ